MALMEFLRAAAYHETEGVGTMARVRTMKQWLACFSLMFLYAGCDQRGGPAEPLHSSEKGGSNPNAAPRPGEKKILPGMADLWINLDDMRKQAKMLKAGTWNLDDPEVKTIDTSRVGLLGPGDLVEVLEIGEDYVAVNALRNRSGEPINKHGYITKWW
jgi:hypothetical protein